MTSSSLKFSILRAYAVAATMCGLLSCASLASAQLVRVGNSLGALEPGVTMRGTDTAYDPRQDLYLLVAGNGPIYGIFVNSAGVPVTPVIAVMDGSLGWGHFPRVEYSPDVAGGLGGFLVTWHHNAGAGNAVFGRLVTTAVAGYLASPIQLISDGADGGSWWETGPAMAYSRTSRRFLVAWRTLAYGVSGRFVDTNGVPFWGVQALAPPVPGAGTRDPALAWNPGTDEFGLLSTGWDGRGALASFRRIRAADGFIWGRADFGISRGTFSTAIDVNTLNNNYVLAWGLHPGTMTAIFSAQGALLTSNLASARLGFDQSLGLAFNPASGTSLAVSSDGNTLEIGAVEIRVDGAPNTTTQLITDGARLGSFHPMVTARGNINHWDVAYSRDFRGATSQVIGTWSTGGGGGGPQQPPPPPPPTGCTTPDPFVSIGGGRCVNGGWLPGGGTPPPGPPPPPPPPPTGCTTPDPFTSIGGGTCVNGGWVPRSSSCTTPDPFVSIGGGRCVNGGWLPGGGSPPPGPPPPPPTGCSTPDPFASIGGGACVSGGWVPRTSQSSCATPDPFVSLGGGVCVSGGWRPR